MRYPTITRNNDFRRAYARGRSFVGGCIVLYVCKNRAKQTRIGITCSKKIGNAVQRNRARRVIRAAVDAVLPKEGVGAYDLVIVARSAATQKKSTQVAAVLQKLAAAAGLPDKKPEKKQPPACAASASPASPVAVREKDILQVSGTVQEKETLQVSGAAQPDAPAVLCADGQPAVQSSCCACGQKDASACGRTEQAAAAETSAAAANTSLEPPCVPSHPSSPAFVTTNTSADARPKAAEACAPLPQPPHPDA